MENVAATLLVRDIYDVYHGTVLPILLKDKTTGKNIIWATDEYKAHSATEQIKFEDITGASVKLIQPRALKSGDSQKDRTKKRAEVFTPLWVCNRMNNVIDDGYLGYAEAFNVEEEDCWSGTRKKISFPEGTSWQEYVDQRRLEITCGEAPFVTSRYNPVNGEMIEVKDRIGFLDRKLRVAAENTEGEEYGKCSLRALQSSYGYELQGDNLLIARINVFLDWVEHQELKTGERPDVKTAKRAANIITWNFWQMDGLSGKTPRIEEKDDGQITIPGFETEAQYNTEGVECKIYDWRANHSQTYNSLKTKEGEQK